MGEEWVEIVKNVRVIVGLPAAVYGAWKALRELALGTREKAKENRIRQALAARDMLKDLFASAKARAALQMLDWSGRQPLVRFRAGAAGFRRTVLDCGRGPTKMGQDRAASRTAGTLEEDAMKRILPVLAATALAAGCATVGTGPAAESEVDAAYVAAVESAAKRFGTQVIWVNYPRKRASSTQ